MAFFTRVNTTLPVLPTDECRSEHSTSTSTSMLTRMVEQRTQCNTANSNNTNCNTNNSECDMAKNNKSKDSSDRYEYVVDRVLGVEV